MTKVNLPAVIANGIDVTVSPVGNIPYITVGNSVIRFNRLRQGTACLEPIIDS